MFGLVVPTSGGQALANTMACHKSITPGRSNHPITCANVWLEVPVVNDYLDGAVTGWPNMLLQPGAGDGAGGENKSFGKGNLGPDGVGKVQSKCVAS